MPKVVTTWNIWPHVSEPVHTFLSREQSQHKRVGRLLDYGYDTRQIADMLHMPEGTVWRYMSEHDYKTIDELKTEWIHE